MALPNKQSDETRESIAKETNRDDVVRIERDADETDEKGTLNALSSSPANGAENLQRCMKSRHIQMISIGGVIGTGLFLGTAGSLAKGGPLGLLMGYAIMGTVVWNVMASLGEMVAHLPIEGGHVTLARRFVGPSLSFTMGWNYWYNWAIVLPTEISASAVLVNYWTKSVNNAVWITIFLLIVGLINLGGARFYAEFEFWFASIKVVTIVGLIILGIILDAGGGPDHDAIGFRYWNNPGPFVQYLQIEGSLGRFLGFWAVLIQASFSYIGTEITAITAGEAKNPKKSLPSAIKGVAVRILLFYIMGVFVIGLLVPSNDPRLNLDSHDAASSPFVIAIQNSGIKTLPSIINAALLSSAWSAASSDMYTSSRALHGLALAGNAPAIFKKTTSWGLPWLSLVVSFIIGFLAYMSVGVGSAGEVFGWLSTMTSVTGLLTWVGILITYLRFDAGVKAQSFDRSQFPYKSQLRTVGATYALVMCCLILFFNSYTVFINDHWNTADFITGYFPIALAFILYFSSQLYYRKTRQPYQIIGLHQMDFYTDSRDESRDAEEDEDYGQKKTMLEKFKAVSGLLMI
ncbi:amino acid permease/ SLC12A domain-containing protein [Phakopsora pachyrhizi]|uniref:Amino acid permease/ SLC12A domain-containing protein n=1 Tax=Phakopsora pachyrhizi TaxID=170000 RepID=A0AAV0BQT0_PHAPC|nr:amino acid permease/ SLC12A domain-containing protein [Phakopsora pachyrhizi]CAH7689730.1 amino acid permease/ SLC12A domain-containing protein [Phakopsora pachyrhizi]